jgi:arylsulfatase A
MGLAAPARLPNIVVILADDLGYGDLGCYNPESRIPTPNLDRLAGQGVRFTDMHSPSAVCTPTRYGLLTGRYCWRTSLKHGVLQGYSPNLIEPGRATIASLLNSHGYFTACVGKWHLGLGDLPETDYARPLHPGPNDHGFDYFFGIPASLDMPPYLYVENDRVVEQATSETPGSGGGQTRGRFWRPGAIAPSLRIEEVLPTLTRRSVKVIEERASGAQPFFLYFPMTGPHTPWVPTSPYQRRSRAGEYGDFVTQVDDSVAQVLQALDRTGAAANTLVVFASDNGAYWSPADIASTGHRSNAQWRGMKADVYEGGHRVPFIARWPGHIRPASTSAELACLTDLFATTADIVKAPIPSTAAEDSFNLRPALEGQRLTKPIREAAVLHSMQGVFVVRQGSWKLILGRGSGGFTQPVSITPGPGDPAGELYNLQEDPAETRNLYQQQTALVARLTALLAVYRERGRSR